MNKNNKYKKLAIALVIGLGVGNAMAGSVLDNIKKTSQVHYGYNFAAMPYSYVNKDWNPMGYSFDICKDLHTRLEKDLGLKLKEKVSEVNNQNNIAMIKNGTIDIECGSTTQTEERLKQVNAVTIQADKVSIATKASFNGKSIEDLKGKTVITLAGTTAEKLLRKASAEKGLNLSFNLAKDYTQAFLLLNQGRGEAVVSDSILLRGEIADSDNPKDFKLLEKDLNELEPIGIVFSKDDKEFAELVTKNLNEMKKSGKLEELYAKWFMNGIPPKNINFNIPLTEQAKKLILNK